jgi:hypothetical protein
MAIAYVEAEMDGAGRTFGVARHANITIASLRATCGALNRLLAKKESKPLDS